MLSRRAFLKSIGGAALGLASLSGYAFGVEPGLRLAVARYAMEPPGWSRGLRLRVVALADLHACRPWMTPARVAAIVERANALSPDLIVLLGDYVAGHRFVTGRVADADWSRPLGRLKAPLGVHAILGNHDWWDDGEARRARRWVRTEARRALEGVGIPVLENEAVRLAKDGEAFWLAGLADQLAFPLGGGRFQGLDDLAGTLAQVTDDGPVILLAHEPDIFPAVPSRVALTLCGHTHGGQVRVLGYSPVVPSAHGNRYAYGHVEEGGRHLLVSGGLGCSILPMRLGVPPEITVVELRQADVVMPT